MVNIKITLCSAYHYTDPRNRALLNFAKSKGCVIEQNKRKPDRTWRAISHAGEGEEIKEQLRRQGFADKDFKIYVEYQRSWGFL